MSGSGARGFISKGDLSGAAIAELLLELAMLGLRRALLALFALGVIFAGLDVALVAHLAATRTRRSSPRSSARSSG